MCISMRREGFGLVGGDGANTLVFVVPLRRLRRTRLRLQKNVASCLHSWGCWSGMFLNERRIGGDVRSIGKLFGNEAEKGGGFGGGKRGSNFGMEWIGLVGQRFWVNTSLMR